MIGRDEAVDIARGRAIENGWAFADPVDVVHRRGWFGGAGRYEIHTNATARGTKARFVIDAESGAIISEGYVPR